MENITINVRKARKAFFGTLYIGGVYLFMEMLRRALIWPLFPTESLVIVGIDALFQALTLFVMLLVLFWLVDDVTSE